MTTDPTPHTERAAAAAAEIAAGCGLLHRPLETQMAAIIAKHFNDDAAELAKLRGFYDEIVREVGHDQIIKEHRQRGELLRREARRRKEAESQHDALRLAAGRALERLKRLPEPSTYLPRPTETQEIITALSAALEGDKGKET